MEVKGSFTVKSIVTAGRRANEGLVYKTVEADLALDKYAHKHQYYTVISDHNIILPDATTLQPGWGISIHSSKSSVTKASIVDFAGTPYATLSPKKTITLILLANTDANNLPIQAGVWRIVKSGGTGLGSGNVPVYSDGPIFEAADKGVETFTVYSGWNDGTNSGSNVLYYTLKTTTVISGGGVKYIWTSTGSDIPLYTLTDRVTGFTVYGDTNCTSTADITSTMGSTTRTLYLSNVHISSSYFIGGVNVNPFIANVMDGMDEGGDTVDDTIFFNGGTAISTPSSFPKTVYVYITNTGIITEEKARQRGGNTWPVEPIDGDIFFFKPLRRNYKYSSQDGWVEYPCTALGELTFVSANKTIVREYPKNEWWWDYKYGEKRNTVIISSGTVLIIPDFTGVPVGSVISGVKVGNIVATVADGFDPNGLAVDNYVVLPYDVEVPYTLGTPVYYYVLKDGTIEASHNKPAGGDELPNLSHTTSYADGAMFYSRNDGKNFKLLGGKWEEYPAVCVASINDIGEGKVVPFNTDAFGSQVIPHSQLFLNASAATTAVTVDEEILDPGHLTVNVCNTVLQSNTYHLQSDNKTILFDNSIEPGLQIEVRWYIPADVTVVRQADVTTVDVADFNNFSCITMYSFVHTERNVTQNPPLNVTADWFVTYLTYGGYKHLRAYQLDNPAVVLYRTCINGVWTAWNFAAGSWFAGV